MKIKRIMGKQGVNRWRFMKECFFARPLLQKKNPQKNNNDPIMQENIYTGKKQTTFGVFLARFDWVHVTLKYKLFAIPLLLFEKTMGKRLAKEVPPETYNKNLRLFTEAYDSALKKWSGDFLYNLERVQEVRENEKSKYWATHHRPKTDEGFRLLRNARDAVLTVALTDSAYREFMNIFALELGARYAKEYAGKTPQHLFYTRKSINDPNYFYLWTQLHSGAKFVHVKNSKEDYWTVKA